MSEKKNIYTEEQVERARNVDVKSFLEQTEGYIFTKSGKYLKCIDGHGFPSSLSIDTHTNMIFYNAKTGNKPLSALNWCTEIRQMSFQDSLKFILHEDPGGERTEESAYKQYRAEEHQTEEVRKTFELPEKAENNNTKNVFAYLTQTRCIAPHIVGRCIKAGKIIQDEHNNAVFIGHDPSGKPCYGARRGTGQKPFKRDVSGSDKRYAFSLIGKNTETIYVTEAAIDALSLATLTDMKSGKNNSYQKNTYLSTGGAGIDASIDEFCKNHPEVKKIYVCFDNDEAGIKGYNKIKEKYTAMGKDVIHQPPDLAHDYNDLLVSKVKGTPLPQHSEKTSEAQTASPETEEPPAGKATIIPPIKEKSTLTVDEDDILKMSEKIQQNIMEDRSFAQSLDNFLNSTEKSSSFLVIGKTSNALAVAGADQNLEVVIAPQTIAKCMAEADERYHGHGLSEAIMKQIPHELRNPVMIFKGSKDDSLVAITELKDKENRGIMIAISLSETGKRREINRISSVYGKDNMSNYLNTQISHGNLIACNKKKANEMLQSAGLQLPLEEAFISFDNSITYSMQNVKHFDTGIERNQPEKERVDETLHSVGLQLPLENTSISSDKSITHTEANVNTIHTAHEPKKQLVKINEDYYRSLSKDQRYIMQIPKSILQPVMDKLNADNIPFSAAERSGNITAVTVSFENSPFLNTAIEKSSREHVAKIAENSLKPSASLAANRDYYDSLSPDERFIVQMPRKKAAEFIQSLKESGCQYSASENFSKGTARVTISKNDKKAMTICSQYRKANQQSMGLDALKNSSKRITSQHHESPSHSKKHEQHI